MNLEINSDCLLPCQSDPKLCIFTVSSLLFCICDVRPVKWVMGSVRRWCARWGCEKPHRDGENPPALRRYLGPGKLFKGRLAAVQRSGPESTALRTRAAVSVHTFIAFHIISTHCPDSARMRYVTSVAIPVWYRGHRSEHRMFTRSSVRHEQSCSGRTLAGSGPWQVLPLYNCVAVCFVRRPRCARLCLFLRFWHMVPLPMAMYSI